MKTSFSVLVSTGLLALALSFPALAQDSSDGITIPVAPSGSSTSTKTKATKTIKTAPSAAPAAPTNGTPPSATDVQTTTSVKAGNLVVSDMSYKTSGDQIDVFFSIKNNGKTDERLGGAETAWSSTDFIQVNKEKGGKDAEGPVAMVLPAGKTTEFSKDSAWLRIKDADKEPKNATALPVTLFFRSSPNARLTISSKASSGSSILNWFSK